MLKNTSEDYFCSVKTSDPTPDDDDFPETFTDTDTFEISLCHNQNDGSKLCKVLDDEYAPFTNSKEHKNFGLLSQNTFVPLVYDFLSVMCPLLS